ncbi:PhnD/SsuA/transferrin family substrate-binding protein [Deferribacterales bacterium Es71-Z0220]|uniref:PhnD/SsuA/transferrin family substrate-binding protein n=1 Tax=Deferrivibrio essentukiensis TaxID=2880922 RepID=UPI001F6046B1|nr:PhnD/SsuA/transferrin family substrate-binding protein [Deferrivibrio essentukiensis]MCB4204891.1 PhnD/SsuA/transferrin family substrate-binding protein [Deferrivibrio essentukiensis]
MLNSFFYAHILKMSSFSICLRQFSLNKVKKNIFFYFFLYLIIFSLVACNGNEDFKEIDLSKTQKISISDKNLKNVDNNTIYVGFDLRWEPTEDVAFYMPLIKYLEAKTGFNYKIKVPRNYPDNIHMLGKGSIDISLMGTVSCLLSGSKYGSYPIVFGLNGQSQPYYKGAIIKKAGNKTINSLKDIKHKKFVFGNKYSTQGYLIPRKMLEDAGIYLKDLEYEFSDSHKDVVNKVVNGFADAGAIQDKLAFKMAEEGILDIVKLSKPFPSSTVCVSPYLSSAKKNIIKAALLEFNPKNGFKSDLWKFTEMENGFTDAENVRFGDLMSLINKYYNLK